MPQVEARTILAVGTVLIAGFVVWRVSRAASGAASALGSTISAGAGQLWAATGNAATAVNPLNPNNVFYTGVNNVGSAATGVKDWSLGSAFYDWLHPEEGASLTGTTGGGWTSGGGGDYQGNGATGGW